MRPIDFIDVRIFLENSLMRNRRLRANILATCFKHCRRLLGLQLAAEPADAMGSSWDGVSVEIETGQPVNRSWRVIYGPRGREHMGRAVFSIVCIVMQPPP